jgi:RNA polymerase sigma factor (TIGR02999 family)
VPEPKPENVTALLQAWRRGEPTAEAALLPLVYNDLRARAAGFLRGERRDHTLQPTALVNEAYLRLIDQHSVDWQDRAHFFAMAARMMRRVLLDHARKHGSAKRGGGKRLISLEDAGEIGHEMMPDLIALDDALEALARLDPERAAIVEMRFFGGLTIEETAAAVGCSTATVERHWRTARAFLFAALSADGDPDPPA